ncbi:hypothetical protein [Taibaiella soli]|nr:hypothetical protein [Taibaiella soli]
MRNNITIVNIYNRRLSLVLHLDVPKGINLISQNDVVVELNPGENQVVPITLGVDKTTLADMKEVKLDIRLKNPAAVFSYNFWVKILPVQQLIIVPVQRDFVVSKDDREVNMGLRIKNTGNITNNFYIAYSSRFFQLDKKIKLSLPPLKDTIVYFKYTVPLILLHDISTERIISRIGNDTNYQSYSFSISKVTNHKMMHQNAFATFPVMLEAGYISSGMQHSYYWGFNAAYQFDNNNSLNVNYHSRQYGIAGIQRDVFSVYYKHNKWDMMVGQLSDFRNFYTNGLGAQVTYHKNDYEGVSVMAITNWQSIPGAQRGQLLTGEIRYKVKKVLLSTLAAVNQDQVAKVNSYLFLNTANLINTERIHFRVTGGIGIDHFTNVLEKAANDQPGYSAGYNFAYIRRKWSFTSDVLMNSSSYPGIYKGWRSQSHVLSYNLRRNLTISGYYNSNFTRQTYFIDSVYYDNRFLYNNTNFGGRLAYSYKSFGIAVGGGYSTATGLISANLPLYKSGTLDLNYRLKNVGSISINSILNYNDNFGLYHEKVLYYANRASFQTRWGGLNLMLNKMPYLPNFENQDSLYLMGYRDVVSFSPYVYHSFLHQKLQARLQFNYYKATQLKNLNLTESFLLSLSYSNPSHGLDILLYGNYFLNTESITSNYGTLTVRKMLNVPIITQRKYYDLSMIIFEDKNGNGKKDEGDPVVQDARVDIDAMSFLSNNKGIAVYRNVEKGTYTLDFHNLANSANGLIPSRGFRQTVTVAGNTQYEIPFNKGKVIKGYVYITFDSLSSSTFTKDRLRITAIDSAGEKFTTLTDEDGNYILTVPENTYVVSMNPEAFDDNFKPVQMSYSADLVHNPTANIIFHVKQKARKVNKIKSNINNEK